MKKSKKNRYRTPGRTKVQAKSGSSLLTVRWQTDRTPLSLGNGDDFSEERVPEWPAEVPSIARALKPRSGLHVGHRKGGVPVQAFAVFGVDEDRLRHALKHIQRELRRTENFVPLILTDSNQHTLVRRSGMLFEYFPKSVYFRESESALLDTRLRTLWRKWRPVNLIDLGKPGLLRSRVADLDYFVRKVSEPKTRFDPKRDPPPLSTPVVADVAALKAEYLAKGLDRSADTFVLYRILGNDLPPRHEVGQTLGNLRFILENEPDLPDCEKRWVVNRIADAEQEQALIRLLEEKKQPFIHIPFDLDEYRKREWDLERFPQPTFFLNGRYSDMQGHEQLRAEAHARRHKNNYVMNNNGARNAALRDGRHRAKWILPWDGNCFLTSAAWAEVRRCVTEAPHFKYFTVPMFRAPDNALLLKRNFRPDAGDEPQLLFRVDASEEFDEDYHYGRRPKVELFWRLGIPGVWDGWRLDSWDLPRPERATEAGDFSSAGWVARLHSGRDDLEGNSKSVMTQRSEARSAAIISMIDDLDRRAFAANFDPTSLKAYDYDSVTSMKSAPADSAKGMLYSRLQQEAELALQRGPYSVTDKTMTAPSGDRHDYYHPAPYWWPGAGSGIGNGGRLLDRKRVPGTELYGADSDRYDRTRLQRLFDDTTILALAGSSSGRREFSRRAAILIRHWFLDPETRMNPHLEYAQVKPGTGMPKGRSWGLIEMKDLYFFLDAVRLVERSGEFTKRDSAGLREWMVEYLEWFLKSDQGREECRAANNHGTCFDLQVAAISAYIGDVDALIATFRRSRERIAGQFDDSGKQTHELKRTQTEHYCAFNLQCWVNLANLAARCGDNLWQYRGMNGRSLAVALRWLLSRYCAGEWPYEQIEVFDRDRYLPLIFSARAQCDPDRAKFNPLGVLRKPLFFPHDGIMPFWMLSSSLRPSAAAKDLSVSSWIERAETLSQGGALEGGVNVLSTKELGEKLWSAYPQTASNDLETVVQSSASSNEDRAFAAWTLGRWYAFRGDPETALLRIRDARELEGAESLRLVLAEASCLIDLNRGDEARTLQRSRLERFPDDPNLFLQLANTYLAEPGNTDPGSERARLSWINRLYKINGLATVQKKDPDSPLNFFNIVGRGVPGDCANDVREAKISVIMPVYNGGETIGNAIESVQAQTCSNLQIIVVDDSSTDGTREIVEAIAESDPRVELVRLRTNGGAYVARNAGMELADGTYVTVHDADDWSHPQKLEMQLHRLLDSRDAVAVVSRWVRMRPDLFVLGFWRMSEHMMSDNFSSLLIRKDLLRDVGLWDTVRAGADNEFRWRLRTKYGDDAVTYTSKLVPLAFSLVRPDSLTGHESSHITTLYHGVRKDYQRSYRRWQQSMAPEDLALTFADPSRRAFPAPRPLLPTSESAPVFNAVFVSDFSPDGHNIEVISGLIARAAVETGAVAIFHWPDYENRDDSQFHPAICELLDSFAIEEISAFQKVRATEIVLCDPFLARIPIEGLPDFGSRRLTVLCNYAGSKVVVFDPRRRRMPTQAELERLFSAPSRLVNLETYSPAGP